MTKTQAEGFCRHSLSVVRLTILICLTAGIVAITAAQQQQPTFRSGVDLVTIDVSVLDKTGAPVTSLTAEDFTVLAGNKPRRIVAVDFVRSTPATRAAAFRAAPVASSNRRLVSPRTIILLVDVTQIPSGGGRTVMQDLGNYLDKLPIDDRVGVMTLTDTLVPPTTNRVTAKEALARLVGTSGRLRDLDMTFGEAPGIAQRDRPSLRAYWTRIAEQVTAMPGENRCVPPLSQDSVLRVPDVCVRQAETTLERSRFETRSVLGRITNIAQALETVPEPKGIVVVSGGLFSDGSLRTDFLDIAGVTERSHVAVSALLVEADGSSGGASNSDTKRLDSNYGFGGLSDLTTAARGTAQRIVGPATVALGRVDRELAGHYLIAFERDPADREGGRLDLDVRTKRPGLTVLSRKTMTLTRPFSMGIDDPAKDPKSAIAALLKSSTAVSQVAMSIDAIALPSSGSGHDARIILTIEVGRSADAVAAFGFQLATAAGKVIADGFDAPAKLQQLADGRSAFVTNVPATDGDFIVRAAAIDAHGGRGSLQHTFEIAPWTDSTIRLSDLMFGGVETGDFLPGTGTASAHGLIGVRLILRDASGKFDDVKVRVSVVSAADGGPIDMADATIQQTDDPFRRFANAGFDVQYYPPGEYAATAVVTSHGTEIGRRTRVFVR